jgi:hypothetical protein
MYTGLLVYGGDEEIWQSMLEVFRDDLGKRDTALKEVFIFTLYVDPRVRVTVLLFPMVLFPICRLWRKELLWKFGSAHTCKLLHLSSTRLFLTSPFLTVLKDLHATWQLRS